MHTIKINILDAIKISNTKKDFFLYDIDKDNKVTRFKLTNDLIRYRKSYDNFVLTEVIKVNNLTNINF